MKKQGFSSGRWTVLGMLLICGCGGKSSSGTANPPEDASNRVDARLPGDQPEVGTAMGAGGAAPDGDGGEDVPPAPDQDSGTGGGAVVDGSGGNGAGGYAGAGGGGGIGGDVGGGVGGAAGGGVGGSPTGIGGAVVAGVGGELAGSGGSWDGAGGADAGADADADPDSRETGDTPDVTNDISTVAKDCLAPSCLPDAGSLELALWLTADRGMTCDTTVTPNRVTLWKDQTGGGHDATPAGVNGPRCLVDGHAINGQTVPSFTAPSGDRESDVFAVDLSFLVASDFTIFVVERRQTAFRRMSYLIGSALPPDAGVQDGCTSTNAGQRAFFAGFADSAIFRASVWGDACDLDVQVAEQDIFNKPVAVDVIRYEAASGYRLFVNGVDKGGSSRTGGLTSITGGFIGRAYQWDGVTDTRFRGDIAEVLMYRRALSTDERGAVERYLSQHWGLTF